MRNTDQINEWRGVQRAYNQYMYHEAAERGYDALAARQAQNDFYTVKAAYEKKWCMLWEQANDPDRDENGELTEERKAELKAKYPGPTDSLPAPAGHNNPPPNATPEGAFIFRIAQENEALITEVQRLANAKAKECTDDAYAERLTSYIKRLTTTIADVERVYRKEKDPIVKQGKIIDTYFKSLTTKLETAKRAANAPLTAYMRYKEEQEREALRAAAEALRKEADAQAAAQESLWEAGRPVEAGEALRAADRIDRHADSLEASAMKTGAAIAQVRSATASASLRKYTMAEIVDRNTLDLEALRPYLPAAALQTALNAYVKATKATELKGAKIYETTEAGVR